MVATGRQPIILEELVMILDKNTEIYPGYAITRQGDKCLVRFTYPCERELLISAEVLRQLAEEDLYELCLDDLRQTLAACRLELARQDDVGAFCVRWTKS